MSKTLTEPREAPAAWFAVLEAARRRGDVALAAEAMEQLRRLGVIIILTPAATVWAGTSQGDRP
jgi:hypothetical protein